MQPSCSNCGCIGMLTSGSCCLRIGKDLLLSCTMCWKQRNVEEKASTLSYGKYLSVQQKVAKYFVAEFCHTTTHIVIICIKSLSKHIMRIDIYPLPRSLAKASALTIITALLTTDCSLSIMKAHDFQ